MTTNPFDDETGIFKVLNNAEGQYSLWPAKLKVPSGWTVVHDDDTRQECIQYIDENWTDMRPKSLIQFMEGRSQD